MKIFITGGTGFVGSFLIPFLIEQGHDITTIGTSGTHKLEGRKNFQYISADTTEKGKWQDELENKDAVINLAGINILKYWTKKYKNQIYDSRILTTRNIVDALPAGKNIVLCSTSAAGYYGNKGDEVLTEKASPGSDFLARVCIDWEKEAYKAREKGARVAITRFGVVLGRKGGALAKMIPAFRFFTGGPLGGGMQWFPWIHAKDLASVFAYILDNRDMDGPINTCAPEPVRNRKFAKTLGRVLHRPSFLPAPAMIIRLVMGEMGASLMNSQRAVPEKLTEHGFCFQYPDVESALRDIIE
jgi:uncharacterized protein (TIGR01777 family)